MKNRFNITNTNCRDGMYGIEIFFRVTNIGNDDDDNDEINSFRRPGTK